MSRRAIASALLCAASAAGAAQTYSADSKSSKEYGYFINLPPGNSPIDAAFTQCAGNVCYDNRLQAGTYGQAARNRIASRGYTVTSADSTSSTLAGGSMSLQAPQAGAAGLVAATVTLRLIGDSAIVADDSSMAWAGFYLSLTAAQSWAKLSEYETVRLQPPDDPSYRMWRSGPDTVTASLNLPVGSFNWFLLLQTAARGYTQLGQYSAESTFSVSFIEGQPVFGLPEGYSVWSQDFNIVDNQWCPNGCAPVPEPGNWALMGLGLLTLLSRGWTGRRGPRPDHKTESALPSRCLKRTPMNSAARSLYACVALAWAVIFAAGAVAQPADPSTPSKAIPFEDIPFAPLNLAQPGAMQAHVLWGAPASGPSAMYLKFGQVSLPLHLHSADYHLLVVQGTMKHWVRGEAETDARPLGPGSYWFQPGGQVHADACLSDSCLVFLVWSGPRDGRMAPPDPPR